MSASSSNGLAMPANDQCNLGLDGAADPNDVLDNSKTVLEDSKQRAALVREVVRAEDARQRELHPWLQYQNAIGFSIWIVSALAHAAIGYAFLTGHLHWFLTVTGIAFFGSFLHELEHDLIHDQYFKHNHVLQDVMLYVIWICKLGANPWERKRIHLKHHRFSGQKEDVEERLIGLGLPLGLRRIWIMLNPIGSAAIVRQIYAEKSSPEFRGHQMRVSSRLTYIPYELGTFLFFAVPYLPTGLGSFIYNFSIIMCWPNTLRQFCLIAISTYCHYYGDIPKGDVFFQNQVLDHWILTPLQMFCCWFGYTHIIHHYFVPQPFYLRTMCAAVVTAELIKQGARHNDFGVVRRANRFHEISTTKAS